MTMLGKCAGLVAIAGVAVLPAVAQDIRTASEKVVACQSVADATERLACFETAAADLSALLSVQAADAPISEAAAETPTDRLAETAVQAPSASETQLVQQATTLPAPAPDAGQAPIQQAAVEAPAEPESSGLPSWIPRVSFGERRDVEREPDQFETTLTRIQRNNLGRHFFTTAEGHVWKQKGLDKIKAPSALPTDVVLDKNIMGGITIKILETKEAYPVTRVE